MVFPANAVPATTTIIIAKITTGSVKAKRWSLERARRIERLSVAWNAAALPLSYARSADDRARYAGRLRLGI